MTEYKVKHYDIELSEVKKKTSRCLTTWKIKVKMHKETLVGILNSLRHMIALFEDTCIKFNYI